MRCRLTIVVPTVIMAALLLPSVAGAQAPLVAKPLVAKPPVSAPPARALPPPAPAPRLDRSRRAALMRAIAVEHSNLRYAGHFRNWPLAAYALDKIREAMVDAKALMPASKKKPLAKRLDAVIAGPVKKIGRAIRAGDISAFGRDYDRLTEACNGCHQAAGLGFLVMRRPRRRAFPDLKFRRR